MIAEKGLNLVKSGRPGVFQEIIAQNLDRLSTAIWLDVGNEASTYQLAAETDEETLDRVQVARAFTPYQHNTLANTIGEMTESSTEMLILPNVDVLYHELSSWEKRQMMKDSWAEIKRLTRSEQLKTVYSVRSRKETPSTVLESAGNFILDLEEERKKKYYYRDRGSLQTTMNYWRKPSCEVKTNGADQPNLPEQAGQVYRKI